MLFLSQRENGCKSLPSHMFKVGCRHYLMLQVLIAKLLSDAAAPRARSGFLMTTHPSEDAIFVFGGYSKEKVASTGGGAGGGKKSEGKIHTDM